MITEDEFIVLRLLEKNRCGKKMTQRSIAALTGFALGKVNSIVKALSSRELISPHYEITKGGLLALKPYRVKRAVILSAGMSVRFAPFDQGKPKGLMECKGEVLIERQIRQLREPGVKEIVVVVGYRMDLFFYLIEKYGVRIVVSSDYAERNNHSSIYAARAYTANAYICCSDSYYTENIFEKYEYKPIYTSVFAPDLNDERAMVVSHSGRVVSAERPFEGGWIMTGHSYWDKVFSDEMISIIESEYHRPDVRNWYWETFYIEHIDRLSLFRLDYPDGIIYDIDTLEDMLRIDPDYYAATYSEMIDNICQVLCCAKSDIKDFKLLHSGLENASFSFAFGANRYVYRHPGRMPVGSRLEESAAVAAASKCGADSTLVYMDEKGWRISRYVEQTREFDPFSKEDLSRLAEVLRSLHSVSNCDCSEQSDWLQARDIMKSIEKADRSTCFRENNEYLIERLEKAHSFVGEQGFGPTLCHNDIYPANILLIDDGVALVDWEFAAMGNPCADISKLFTLSDQDDLLEINEILQLYYQRTPSKRELSCNLASAALCYYKWFVWGVLMDRRGKGSSESLFTWYERANRYLALFENAVSQFDA